MGMNDMDGAETPRLGGARESLHQEPEQVVDFARNAS